MKTTTVTKDYKSRKETLLTKGETVYVKSITDNYATVMRTTDPSRKEIFVPVSHLDL